MRKVNQDSFLVLKDFAQVQKLWMLGVMDGHGANGHNVSQFVKYQLPAILHGLMTGLSPQQAMESPERAKKSNQADSSAVYFPLIGKNPSPQRDASPSLGQ